MTKTERAEFVLVLFERYYDRVYRFARRSVDAETAEDVAQDVFARLLKTEGLERKSIGSSYLVKVADNIMKRRFRQAQRHGEAIEERVRSSEEGDRRGSQGIGRLEFEERRLRCEAGYRALGPHEQEALRLIVAGGMSYQAVAESLGVKVTAVNNWKHRGIQRLKSYGTVGNGSGDVSDGRSQVGRGAEGRDGRGQRAG